VSVFTSAQISSFPSTVDLAAAHNDKTDETAMSCSNCRPAKINGQYGQPQRTRKFQYFWSRRHTDNVEIDFRIVLIVSQLCFLASFDTEYCPVLLVLSSCHAITKPSPPRMAVGIMQVLLSPLSASRSCYCADAVYGARSSSGRVVTAPAACSACQARTDLIPLLV
jgi:hypothetical protein